MLLSFYQTFPTLYVYKNCAFLFVYVLIHVGSTKNSNQCNVMPTTNVVREFNPQ